MVVGYTQYPGPQQDLRTRNPNQLQYSKSMMNRQVVDPDRFWQNNESHESASARNSPLLNQLIRNAANGNQNPNKRENQNHETRGNDLMPSQNSDKLSTMIPSPQLQTIPEKEKQEKEAPENSQELKFKGTVEHYFHKGKERLKTTVHNKYFFLVAAGDVFLLLIYIAMNVLFRFVEDTRNAVSMVNYNHVVLNDTDVDWTRRPFFDYSLSLEQNYWNNGRVPINFHLPEYAFWVVWFLVPFFLIDIVEFLNDRYLSVQRRVKTVVSASLTLPLALRRIARYYYVFLLHGAIAGLLVALLKLMLAAPRPNFLTLCQGNSTKIPSAPLIVDTDCSLENGTLNSGVEEALRSFPSYHATMAVYWGTFLVLYIHHQVKMVRGEYSSVVSLLLPVVFTSGVGALHRYITFHNTAMDVFWGAVLGLAFALHAVYGTLNAFREHPWKIVTKEQLNQQPYTIANQLQHRNQQQQEHQHNNYQQQTQQYIANYQPNIEKSKENYQPSMEKGRENEAFVADTRSLQFNSDNESEAPRMLPRVSMRGLPNLNRRPHQALNASMRSAPYRAYGNAEEGVSRL